MKKITALFLVLALCLSLCTVAFADNPTVEDFLATVEDFPTGNPSSIPENAWVDEHQNKVYKNTYTNGLFFVTPGGITWAITGTKTLTQLEGGNYQYTNNSDVVTLVMNEGKLVSIEVTENDCGGTYTAPAEAATYTATFTKGEHVTGIQYKVNDGAFAEYIASVTGLVEGNKITIQVTCEEGYTYNGTTEFTVGTADINETINGEPTHTHTFAEAWTTDATNHWHAATCEHTSENADVAAHADNNKDHKCDVCGYVMSQCVDSNHDNKCDICGKNMGGGHHHGGSSNTPTVSAPKTADMGVAIYGVLTVSSLLGMGWVSKKKR